jgi:RNase P subunit RPR2
MSDRIRAYCTDCRIYYSEKDVVKMDEEEGDTTIVFRIKCKECNVNIFWMHKDKENEKK